MPSFTESLKVDEQDMTLYMSLPSGSGPSPAVVVIQHLGGVGGSAATRLSSFMGKTTPLDFRA